MQKNIGSRDAAAKNARVVEGKLLTGKSAVLRLVVLPTFHIYIDLLFAQLVQAENVEELSSTFSGTRSQLILIGNKKLFVIVFVIIKTARTRIMSKKYIGLDMKMVFRLLFIFLLFENSLSQNVQHNI